jgi:hypothetical protein
VAAYLLDHGRFAGVPPTALVTCRVNDSVVRGGASAKVGSLQQFVVADSDCEERGPSAFPVPEVHKICILDIRLANTDRNGSNILARREGDSWQLVPIDHGYCLPAKFEDISFEWMYWPQVRGSGCWHARSAASCSWCPAWSGALAICHSTRGW